MQIRLKAVTMNNNVDPEKIYWIESMVCLFIASEKKISNIDAFEIFSKSKTHSMLMDNDMKMWYFSPEALFQIWKVEEDTDDPRNSPYLEA